MNAVELLKQATRRVCEEGGEIWPDDADAEFDDLDVSRFADVFAELVAADANAARITAQTENEALKARLAASGVSERRAVREAVLAEREACAVLVHDWNTAMTDKLAAAIRARGTA